MAIVSHICPACGNEGRSVTCDGCSTPIDPAIEPALSGRFHDASGDFGLITLCSACVTKPLVLTDLAPIADPSLDAT